MLSRIPIRFSAGLPVLLAVAVAILFYSTLLFSGSLSGHDWSSHHFHYFDWVRESLREHHTFPLYMVNAWITPNFLANAEAPQLGPLVWLLLLISTDAYLKLLIVVFSAAGVAGMLLLLRDLEVATSLAVIASLVFAFNGFFISHFSVGHPWAMGALLLPAVLLLFRRAALGSRRAFFGGALVNALTIFGGQHQPFIWQNLFLAFFAAAWSLQVRSWRPLRAFALLALMTAGLGALKLFPLLAEFADYAPVQRTAGLSPGALFYTLLARGQHAATVYPGLDFAHGSGWWEWAFYAGPLAVFFMLASLWAPPSGRPIALVGVVFLGLAVDWSSLLGSPGPWRLLEDLPVWRTQRSPSRFVVLAVFAFAVGGALGWQELWRRWIGGLPRALPAIALGLALLVFADAYFESGRWQLAAAGAPLAAQDPRPRPLRFGDPLEATAELVGFQPNRVVYRVRATRPARLEFPLRMREGTAEWRVEGLTPGSRNGRLVLDLPLGERDLIMTYQPKWSVVGAATSATSLLACAAAVAWFWRYPGGSTSSQS